VRTDTALHQIEIGRLNRIRVLITQHLEDHARLPIRSPNRNFKRFEHQP
jgi:hypothetical protein